MTLFEECAVALESNFYLCSKDESDKILEILNKFLTKNPYFLTHISNDYNTIENIDILYDIFKKNFDIFVVSDNYEIPIFKTDLHLVLKNFYDVSALSTKIFFISEDYIFTILFPDDHLRYAKLSES